MDEDILAANYKILNITYLLLKFSCHLLFSFKILLFLIYSLTSTVRSQHFRKRNDKNNKSRRHLYLSSPYTLMDRCLNIDTYHRSLIQIARNLKNQFGLPLNISAGSCFIIEKNYIRSDTKYERNSKFFLRKMHSDRRRPFQVKSERAFSCIFPHTIPSSHITCRTIDRNSFQNL
jgi:hypothetical protein